MSITFLCGSVNHWKTCQISQVVVLLTNPHRSFKTCFLPPCRCSLTFRLHSAWQPVGVRVWVHVGPPHLSRVFERVLGFQRGQPSRMVPPCRLSSPSPLSNTHTTCPAGSKTALDQVPSCQCRRSSPPFSGRLARISCLQPCFVVLAPLSP